MAADEFFNRWARKNQQARQERDQQEAALPPAVPVDPYEGRLPTLDDVALVSTEADFSPFLKQGVDEVVKRSALKKLFSDPHFNIMDGLDIYIGDYTKSDPIPPEMMAMLNHAKDLLNPPGLRNEAVMSALDADPPPGAGAAPSTATPDQTLEQPVVQQEAETEPVDMAAKADDDDSRQQRDRADSDAGTDDGQGADSPRGVSGPAQAASQPAAQPATKSDVHADPSSAARLPEHRIQENPPT